VFFSVPSAALATVPASWWDGTTPSGATIFFTEWNGTEWTPPVPRVSPERLRLQTTDDVDALAVEYDYEGGSGSTKIVFSTLPGQAVNQLMYVDASHADVGDDPLAVKADSATTATAAAGTGAANVVGVCFSDPSGRAVELCDATRIWAYVLGTPLGIGGSTAFSTAMAPRLLESSLLRDCPGGNAAHRCTMAGWTASGRQAGMALHLVAVENSITGSMSPWFVRAVRTRPLSALEGDPIHEHVPLPSWLVTPNELRCAYLWSTWVAVSGAELAQAWPTRIRL
jgi:hypothetical protein